MSCVIQILNLIQAKKMDSRGNGFRNEFLVSKQFFNCFVNSGFTILEQYTPLNFITHIFSIISELNFKIKVVHIYFLAGKGLLFQKIAK